MTQLGHLLVGVLCCMARRARRKCYPQVTRWLPGSRSSSAGACLRPAATGGNQRLSLAASGQAPSFCPGQRSRRPSLQALPASSLLSAETWLVLHRCWLPLHCVLARTAVKPAVWTLSVCVAAALAQHTMQPAQRVSDIDCCRISSAGSAHAGRCACWADCSTHHFAVAQLRQVRRQTAP